MNNSPAPKKQVDEYGENMLILQTLKKRWVLHLDLDAFFASVEQVLHPEWRQKAVIVGGSTNRSVVACPSYEARALGIKTAMPLMKAKLLAPNAIFVHGDFARYRAFSERFFDILLEYSDKIEPRSLDEAYLDISHLAGTMKEAHALAYEMQQKIKEKIGLSVSVGVAKNKVCAKVASDLRKPGGITLVQEGKEKQFLSSLPVENLPGIGPRTKYVLNSLGITRIEQLASIPEKILEETFGKSGKMMNMFAQGIDDREVKILPESKSISRSVTLMQDTRNINIIEATTYKLLEKCCAELRQEQRLNDTLTVTVRFADFSTVSRQKKMQQPNNIEREQWHIAQTLLHDTLHIYKPIRLIGITLSNLKKQQQQISLFEYPFSKVKNIQMALDKIRRNFGFEAIEPGRTFGILEKTH